MSGSNPTDIAWDPRFRPLELHGGGRLIVDTKLEADHHFAPDGTIRIKAGPSMEVILLRAFMAGKDAAVRSLSDAYKGGSE